MRPEPRFEAVRVVIGKAALRQRLRRVGRDVYWRLPRRWRDVLVEFSYRHAGAVFRGMGHYDTWRQRRPDVRSRRSVVRPTEAELRAAVAAAEVEVVIFDVFAVLFGLLVAPERLAAVVARRVGGALGETYLRGRAEAERAACERCAGDPGLALIVAELARLAGLDPLAAARLLAVELETRLAAVAPRDDFRALLEHALACGKRVVLAAGGPLPRDAVETLLARHGVRGWHALYLSSELGVRHDGAELFEAILNEGPPSRRALVVAESRPPDARPGSGRLRRLDVLRPASVARGARRFAPLLDRAGRPDVSLDEDLALGLIVRRFFARGFLPAFDEGSVVPAPDAAGLGYLVAGPLCVAFAQWLLDRARADGVERLYFLAREGEFLRQVYDRLAAGAPGAPRSEYLVVSRRAVNVSAIAGREDVAEIARTVFGPGPLEDFLVERFGLASGAGDVDAWCAQGLWSPGRPVMIRDERTAPLDPLLDALLPAILRRGESERPALVAYLLQKSLSSDGRCGVVDVGYSGTIQRRLNRLLGGGVHGYYMATDERTAALSRDFRVRADGCFHHRYSPGDDAPTFVRLSFLVEKLLSSDDPQVIRYHLEDGVPVPEFRMQSPQERATAGLRAQVREGALAFVEGVLEVRQQLVPDFRVPSALAIALFEAFVEGLSAGEQAVMQGLVLDDHYCGRGLVA